MAWIRLDDQIAHHPKITSATPTSLWLYVAALGFSQKYLTNGYIPKQSLSAISHLRNVSRASRELVAAGLWEKVTDGFQIHDYLDFNDSRDELLAKRAADRFRKESVKIPNGIQTESDRNPKKFLARARASDPIRSDPTKKREQATKQQPANSKISTVAAPRRKISRMTTAHKNIRVITKIAHDAIARLGVDSNNLAESVKTACAQRHIAYNSGVVSAAIQSAAFQRTRKRR